MRPHSLRLRLLLGGAVAIGVALGVAWLAMTLLFERHIQRRLADELTRQATPLVAGLRLTPAGVPLVEDEPPDPRFELPSSGLYWQVAGGTALVRSRSLWDSMLPRPASVPADQWRQRTGAGPFGQRLLYVERLVRIGRGSPPITVQLAGDVDTLRRAQEEFGRELAYFLALLSVVLIGAAGVQVALGLRPLATVAGELDRLRHDSTARLRGRYPAEILPLTGAIDALADAREADLLRARRRAADLAHGMKTPLAVLQAQSRRARRHGATDAADGLDVAIDALSGAVHAELRRAKAAMALPGAVQPGGVVSIIDRVTDLIERSETAQHTQFVVRVDDPATIPLREEELLELLGSLVENAARHSRRSVHIGYGPGASLIIEDDGAGIDPAQRVPDLDRDRPIDEAGRYGLGLAIAHDIIEASAGSLRLLSASSGGWKVEISWTGEGGTKHPKTGGVA